jgi:hypothetical protein
MSAPQFPGMPPGGVWQPPQMPNPQQPGFVAFGPPAAAPPGMPAMPGGLPAVPMAPPSPVPVAVPVQEAPKNTVAFAGTTVDMNEIHAMATNLEAVTKAQGEFESDFYKLSAGRHVVRICPPYRDRTWYRFGASHYNIEGPKKGFAHCYEKTFVGGGYKCPFCTVIDWLSRYTDSLAQSAARSYQYVNAVVYEDVTCGKPKRPKPYILRLTLKQMWPAILNMFGLYGDITDPMNGWTLIVDVPATFAGKNSYQIAVLRQGPIFTSNGAPDQAAIQHTLSQLNDLDKLVCPAPTAEKMQEQIQKAEAMLTAWLVSLGVSREVAPRLEMCLPGQVPQQASAPTPVPVVPPVITASTTFPARPPMAPPAGVTGPAVPWSPTPNPMPTFPAPGAVPAFPPMPGPAPVNTGTPPPWAVPTPPPPGMAPPGFGPMPGMPPGMAPPPLPNGGPFPKGNTADDSSAQRQPGSLAQGSSVATEADVHFVCEKCQKVFNSAHGLHIHTRRMHK